MLRLMNRKRNKKREREEREREGNKGKKDRGGREGKRGRAKGKGEKRGEEASLPQNITHRQLRALILGWWGRG